MHSPAGPHPAGHEAPPLQNAPPLIFELMASFQSRLTTIPPTFKSFSVPALAAMLSEDLVNGVNQYLSKSQRIRGGGGGPPPSASVPDILSAINLFPGSNSSLLTVSFALMFPGGNYPLIKAYDAMTRWGDKQSRWGDKVGLQFDTS